MTDAEKWDYLYFLISLLIIAIGCSIGFAVLYICCYIFMLIVKALIIGTFLAIPLFMIYIFYIDKIKDLKDKDD
jgi:hypothetical protein